MYKRCILIRSCSQTTPGTCSQTRPGTSLRSLSKLSLQGRGHFLVMLNQSEQDQEPLSALALDWFRQTGLTPWSVTCYSCFSVKSCSPVLLGPYIWAQVILFYNVHSCMGKTIKGNPNGQVEVEHLLKIFKDILDTTILEIMPAICNSNDCFIMHYLIYWNNLLSVLSPTLLFSVKWRNFLM